MTHFTSYMYPEYKIYGPYIGKDKRARVRLLKASEARIMSYPRLLMEEHLNRHLTSLETIDHIDEDVTNNDISNLRLMSLEENVARSVKRRSEQTFSCPICNTEFKLSSKQLNDATNNRKKGKAGPFCSKSCAGKYGAEVQNGRMAKLPVVEITKSYYKNSDLEK